MQQMQFSDAVYKGFLTENDVEMVLRLIIHSAHDTSSLHFTSPASFHKELFGSEKGGLSPELSNFRTR